MACARVNGVEIQYELMGSGDEVTAFLNGIAMSIAHWKPLMEPLAGRYRCLGHDFRGQLLSPQSPKSGAAIRLGDHAGFARIIQAGVRSSLMETIPGAGHAVVIEQPDAVLRRVERFLAGVREGRTA